MTKNYSKKTGSPASRRAPVGRAIRSTSPSRKQLRDASKSRARLKVRVSELESRVALIEQHLGYSVTRGLELYLEEE